MRGVTKLIPLVAALTIAAAACGGGGGDDNAGGGDSSTVETVRPGGLVISGTFPVTTTIRWSVRFTRLAKRPKPQLGSLEGL